MTGRGAKSPSDLLTTALGKNVDRSRLIADYKYDGERTQIHYFASVQRQKRMSMFSRNFDRQNSKFWHFESLFTECTRSNKTPDFIIDGELVYLDSDSGALLPFQEIERKLLQTHQRGAPDEAFVPPGKRPKLFAFDILALDKESLCHLNYDQRMEKL